MIKETVSNVAKTVGKMESSSGQLYVLIILCQRIKTTLKLAQKGLDDLYLLSVQRIRAP